MNQRSKWGGVRKGAGRPKEENTKKTIVVRVAEDLLPVIKILKEQYQAGQPVESLLNVADNQDVALQSTVQELESELEQFKKVNLDLVLQKDTEHSKAINLQSKANGLQSKINDLKAQLKALQHKEYDCMVLKKDGNRCSRPAKVKVNWHGVEINACLQHSKVS